MVNIANSFSDMGEFLYFDEVGFIGAYAYTGGSFTYDFCCYYSADFRLEEIKANKEGTMEVYIL
jgi:hypothetical protein